MAKNNQNSEEIVRKPILTTANRRNAENHPEFLDTDALLLRFDPLLRSIHKHFCSYDGMFDQTDDQTDLWSQIVYEFLRLRSQFDPKRGVDFPGYIKFHLQQRVYHYVTKQQKYVNNEQPAKSYDGDDDNLMDLENMMEMVDEDTEYNVEKAEALASMPWEDLTPEQIELAQEVLKGKAIEDIAKERKVTIKSVKEQFEELCDYLEYLHKLGSERDQ